MASFLEIYNMLVEKYLYHGAIHNDDFTEPNKKGVWFTVDENSEILKYYSTRGETKRVIKAEILTDNILDLSMYNTDERYDQSDMMAFAANLEIKDQGYKGYIRSYYDSYNMASVSMVLNGLIEEYMIKERKFDGLTIKEGNDEYTVCIFDLTKIRILK